MLGTNAYAWTHCTCVLLQNAAWYYPEPKKAADNIKDYLAFSNGVKVGA